MEVKLEVLVSSSLKHKKPWPRICWVGQEKESTFLLDARRICEINLSSGRRNRKIPKLQTAVKKAISLTASGNGAWLAGIICPGEAFLWNKDRDCLKTVPLTDEVSKLVISSQEEFVKLYLFVSDDGKKMLLATQRGCVCLWENNESKDLTAIPDSSLKGKWTLIEPCRPVVLPTADDKETVMQAMLIRDKVLGDCCLSSFTFNSGDHLILLFLALRWHETAQKFLSSFAYQDCWSMQKISLTSLVPKCEPIKSRGALVSAFSRDGHVLAVALNQMDPKATQILFINTLNFVVVSGNLRGCGSKNLTIPSKYRRSYWVADMCWTHDDLFLACMLKRGSFLIVTRIGELLSLVTFGCSVEFGPAEFIPLHPLITYSSPQSGIQSTNHNDSPGSAASDADPMRQCFSVTAHPRLPYLIVSDGYMATVLRISEKLSPSTFMKSLLLDATQKLEQMHQSLALTQPEEKKLRLCSVSSLKSLLLKAKHSPSSSISTVPAFLQDDDETFALYEKSMQQQCDEESEDDGHLPANDLPSFGRKENSFVGVMDQGKLEFAYMFDTVHAKDETSGADHIFDTVCCIQKILLTAWSTGISLTDVKEKEDLLNYTVQCTVHFAHLLQCLKFRLPPHFSKGDKVLKNIIQSDPWIFRVLRLFRHFLIILLWDFADKHSLGHIVRLVSSIVKLILLRPGQVSHNSLLGCFCLLKLTSHHVNTLYSSQPEVPAVSGSNSALDSYSVPIFQATGDTSTEIQCSLHSVFHLPPEEVNISQKPANRLIGIWRMLYKKVLWYQTYLDKQMWQNDRNGSSNKPSQFLTHLCCQIQGVLQSAGGMLQSDLRLIPITGEAHFLQGLYTEAVQMWKLALQKETGKGGSRTCFLQTRYYLAILYCHLYKYNLSAAQGLCDQIVRELLSRSDMPVEDRGNGSEDSDFDLRTLREVHREAAIAVIKSMARFMAAYFTSEPLSVLPPHDVEVLPPLHIKPGKLQRVVPLQHVVVRSTVRTQHLSAVWTVEYTLDLLLIAGLLPEAAWLAYRLGDWKTAVSLGLAYNLFFKSHSIFSRLKFRELHLSEEQQPAQIFQAKLQSLLGGPVKSEVTDAKIHSCKQFTDAIEEEDADLLFSSVQEILKAAVMADADILSETFQLLCKSAKDHCARFCGLVPMKLYLPAPPLYCPQPASVSEDNPNDHSLTVEKVTRQKVSGVLQRILLLFRAARCSLPAAQWYIMQVKRARKVMNKIRLKGSMVSLSPFPESLLNYCRISKGFFRRGHSGDCQLDNVSVTVIGCFRELCALCWMLHVRDMLCHCCRQYQTARELVRTPQDHEVCIEYDASVTEHCLNALEWACRMLPFCRFMNIEETVQDIILSLIGELPPVEKVAEIFVKAFPEAEDVRVPLRDKYQFLYQRIRHSLVKGLEREDMMSVVIHEFDKVRSKTIKRLRKNVGPIETHIWEPIDEGMAETGVRTFDRFSLGTTLSRSTLTDFGKPQVYSDGETVDTISDALLTEDYSRENFARDARNWKHLFFENRENKIASNKKKYNQGEQNLKSKELLNSNNNPGLLPLVGSWEFECNDDEYVCFLELFLSFLLERDLMTSSDPGIPLLTSFSENLKEHELNSLLFDVHTTLKRRQSKTSSYIYRAGSCYQVTSKTSTIQKPVSSFNDFSNQPASHVPLQSTLGSDINSESCTHPYFLGNGQNKNKVRMKGLFGLKQHLSSTQQKSNQKVSVIPRTLSSSNEAESLCLSLATGYSYKVIVPEEGSTTCRELGPELQNRFSNIGRLLEWMIRWSERRLLCGPTKVERLQEYSTTIRVKTSTVSILASFWLLEERYCTKGLDKVANKVPETQSVVASVFHPEAKLKTGRESSVDTGYLDSGETPLGVDDVNALEEHHENALVLSDITEESEQMGDQHYHQEYITEEASSDKDDYATEGQGDCTEHEVPTEEEVEFPSVTEDETSEQPGKVFCSPNIAVRIRHLSQLNGSRQEKNALNPCMEYSESDLIKEMPKKGTLDPQVAAESSRANSTPSPVFLDVNAAASCGIPAMVFSDDGHSARNVQSFSDIPTSPSPSALVTGMATKSLQRREALPQHLGASENIRQIIQDEVVRLMQFQQINFTNLIQAVGASFSGRSDIQHVLQPSQSDQKGINQSSVLVTHQESEILLSHPAEHTTDTSPPVLQAAARENSTGSTHSEGPRSNKSCDQHNKENSENPPELNLPMNQPRSQTSGTGIIPESLPLLSSTHIRDCHLLLPQTISHKSINLIPVNRELSAVSRIPLLRLHDVHQFKQLNVPEMRIPNVATSQAPFSFSLPPKEAWGPSIQQQNLLKSGVPKETGSAAVHFTMYDLEHVPPAEKQKRLGEMTSKGPPSHLNMDQYVNYPAPTSQRNDFEQRMPEVQPSSQYKTSFSTPTIPLISLKTCPSHPAASHAFPPIVHSTVPYCSVPVRPPTVKLQAKTGLQYLRMPLLQANLPPAIKLLPPPSIIQTPEYFSFENSAAFEQSFRPGLQHVVGKSHPRELQLLKAPTEPFDQKLEQNTSKRQKRHNKKRIEEENERVQKKPTVSFRLGNSIISPRTVDDALNTEESNETSKSQPEVGGVLPQPEEGFILPLGSSDSVLAQYDKISGKIPAVTELHYFASTMKKAVECQDASTNTDTVKSCRNIETITEDVVFKTNEDKPITPPVADLPSEVPQVLPPDVFVNLKYSSDVTPRPKSMHHSSTKSDLKDLVGHRFINMVDISATEILNDLPAVEQTNENVLSKKKRIPSTAELHYIAASVTRPAVQDVEYRESIIKQPWTEIELLETEPVPSSDELTRQLLLHDSSMYTVGQPHKNVPLKQLTKYPFTEKLHEIDVQLSALQNLAENMELDFANTRLLVNTIESMGVVADPHVEATHLFANASRITEDYRRNNVILEDVEEEKEEVSLPELPVVTAMQNSYCFSSAAPASNDYENLEKSAEQESIQKHQSRPVRNTEPGFGRTPRESELFVGDDLHLSGLSDVADIISDLVKDRGVSASELGLSEAQANAVSRMASVQEISREQTLQRKERNHKEIRDWMKKKWKERSAEYQKKLTELREREFSPFKSAEVSIRHSAV
ncbi:ciliogenesis and planar polarity effector 1 [Protopterus annectens]|uniref:ciliogenesis and planar polarity effector 1 n=1 Tax=Protopterus annectens TaxID=7888 RepID=UPI001CF9C7EA|nr:ciliogenesis and planar polarity effector 1 [Protopterus annectens]